MNLYQKVFFPSAHNYPNNIALWSEKKTFTYEALYQLTQQWSRTIQVNNTQHSPVAIYGGKQWQMYAGILAILAAKFTYVPLSNKQPVNRNKTILTQIDCKLLLVAEDEDISELLASITTPLTVIYLSESDSYRQKNVSQHRCFHINTVKSPAANTLKETNIEQAEYAYILFTSGSTGIPKGIAVSQNNIINYITRIDNLLAIKPSDKVGQFFELSFDLSVHDLFSCWAKGAALYVIPINQLFCPTHFIKEHELTVFSAVPSILSFIDKFNLLTPNNLPNLRVSCFGGEKLLTKQALKWQECAPNSRVINLYGPTEFTIVATYYQLNPNNPPTSTCVPIGRALDGLTAILVNNGRKIIATNTLAELYLAGDQLVDGYWKDSKKTTQSFIDATRSADGSNQDKYQLAPARYYRTGDVVYYDNNNDLVFHGRNDHQFKVSGHRVEAADIEACVLNYCSNITWCTVKAITDELTQHTQIIAFIESSKEIDSQALRAHCTSKLPSYMVPDKINCCEYLPRNASGKVDFKALHKSI
jgi:D-alanine--poly(phosphoribitol) ligase subunit 1